MIKCFITDDEEHAANTLKTYVHQTPFLELSGSADNGFDTLDFLSRNTVELLFLDIHMPKISGLEVLKAISTPTILTTAYSEYAIEGFEHDVIDYLLKPISYQRFLKAVQKAAAQKEARAQRLAEPERNYFFVKGEYKGKQIKVNYEDLFYVESSKNYVIFHCVNSKYMAKMNLKDVENMLPKRYFIRIHNSYIVSLEKILALEGNLVVLKQLSKDGIRIPVSPSYRDCFLQQINL